MRATPCGARGRSWDNSREKSTSEVKGALGQHIRGAIPGKGKFRSKGTSTQGRKYDGMSLKVVTSETQKGTARRGGREASKGSQKEACC